MEKYLWIITFLFLLFIIIFFYLLGAKHNRGKMQNQGYELPWHYFVVIHVDSKTVEIESIENNTRFLINRLVVQGYIKQGDKLKKLDRRSEEFEERNLKLTGFDPLVKI